jgi:hypothetical protein
MRVDNSRVLTLRELAAQLCVELVQASHDLGRCEARAANAANFSDGDGLIRCTRCA